MDLREQKILRLQTQQKWLKDQKSSKEVLRLQQQALKRGLFGSKPLSEKRFQKVQRLKRLQEIKKSLLLQQQEEERKIKKIKKELKAEKIKGFNLRSKMRKR